MLEDDADNEIEVWVWRGRGDRDPDEPDERITIAEDDTHLYVDDPHFHGVFAFAINPDDRPATLNIYLDDSVRRPDPDYPHTWDTGPVERGLPFPEIDGEVNPFGCELWGRVLFHVDGELAR